MLEVEPSQSFDDLASALERLLVAFFKTVAVALIAEFDVLEIARSSVIADRYMIKTLLQVAQQRANCATLRVRQFAQRLLLLSLWRPLLRSPPYGASRTALPTKA